MLVARVADARVADRDGATRKARAAAAGLRLVRGSRLSMRLPPSVQEKARDCAFPQLQELYRSTNQEHEGPR
jgi:hypothetical protein